MKTIYKRRKFLAHLAALGAIGGFSAWAHSQPGRVEPASIKKIMLHQLTLDDFTPHLHSRFELEVESSRRLAIELVEAVSLGAAAGPRPVRLAPRTPFSLVFLAPCDPHLIQRTYHIHHAAMGDFDIFLVPIGRDARGVKCEAIFN